MPLLGTSIKALLLWANHAAIAIARTWSSWHRNRACCADADRPTPTICDLHNRGRWAGGSATSSRFCRIHHRVLHSRGDEAAWWKAVKFDPVIVARQLWDYTRIKGAADHRRLGTPLAATAPSTQDTEDRTVDPNVDGASSNPKEPSAGPRADDIIQADRGQGEECPQERRSKPIEGNKPRGDEQPALDGADLK
jgi:hypothetical protein